jgi:hypothetical protein
VKSERSIFDAYADGWGCRRGWRELVIDGLYLLMMVEVSDDDVVSEK